jgi:hypothetical protein
MVDWAAKEIYDPRDGRHIVPEGVQLIQWAVLGTRWAISHGLNKLLLPQPRFSLHGIWSGGNKYAARRFKQ